MESEEQKVAVAKAELVDLIKKKAEISKTMADLEMGIHIYEESYLEETQVFGNIIQGWGRCFANRNTNKRKMNKGRPKFTEADRLFSNSSVTSKAAVSSFIDPPEANNEHNNKVETIKTSKKSNQSIGGSVQSIICKLPIKGLSSGRFGTKGLFTQSESRVSSHDSLNIKMPSAASGSRPATEVDVIVETKKNSNKPKKSNQRVGSSMESSASKPKKESADKVSSGRSSTKGRQKRLHSDSRVSSHDSLNIKMPSAASGSRPATEVDVIVETKKNSDKPKKSNQIIGGSMESSASKHSKKESVDKMSSCRSSTKGRHKRLHSDSRISPYNGPDSKMASAASGSRSANQIDVVVDTIKTSVKPKKSNQSVEGSMESCASKLPKKDSVDKMSSGRSITKRLFSQSDSRVSSHDSLNIKMPSAASGSQPATEVDVLVEAKKNSDKPKKSNQIIGGSMESSASKHSKKESVDKISSGRSSTKRLFSQSDSKVYSHDSLNIKMPSAASGSRPATEVDAMVETKKNSDKPKKSNQIIGGSMESSASKHSKKESVDKISSDRSSTKRLFSQSDSKVSSHDSLNFKMPAAASGSRPATEVDAMVETKKNSDKPKKSNQIIGGSMESSASKHSKKDSVDKMSSSRSSTKGRQKRLHSDSKMSPHNSPDSKMPSAASGSLPATQIDIVIDKNKNPIKQKKSNQSTGGSMESIASKLSKNESVDKMSSGRSSTKERQKRLHSDSRMSPHNSPDSKMPSAASGSLPATQIDMVVEKNKNSIKPKKSNQSTGGSIESSASKLPEKESADKVSSGRSSTKRRQKRLHSNSKMSPHYSPDSKMPSAALGSRPAT